MGIFFWYQNQESIGTHVRLVNGDILSDVNSPKQTELETENPQSQMRALIDDNQALTITKQTLQKQVDNLIEEQTSMMRKNKTLKEKMHKLTEEKEGSYE